MGFLDNVGLAHLWGKWKSALALKMDKNTYDPTGKAQDMFAYADQAAEAAKNASRPSTWTPTANQVQFADGDTFQAKFDSGALTGPQGPKGDQGIAGEAGADGKSAYASAIGAGYTGTEAEFYAALVSLKDGPFLSLSGGTMTGALAMGGNKVTGLGTPTATGDSANKGYVDSKILVFTNKVAGAWSAIYGTEHGYSFTGDVPCAGVTTSHRPDVAFSAVDSVGGNFAPFCESYDGGVRIYSKTAPGATATVTIPSIVCVKGA